MRLVFPHDFRQETFETRVAEMDQRQHLFFILYAFVVLRWSPSLQDEKAKVVEATAAAAARHERHIGGRVYLFERTNERTNERTLGEPR